MNINFSYVREFLKPVVCIVTLWLIPLIFLKYSDQSYPYVTKDDITMKLVGHINNSENGFEICPIISPYLNGLNYKIYQYLEENDFSKQNNGNDYAKLHNIGLGGIWHPPCISRYQVIIILPYRDRTEHISMFLQYIHPFLQRQQISYRIVVVEQSPGKLFNRAKLFNIGYKETKNMTSYTACYIFHDIDLIPENDNNIYACTLEPRHMPTALDTFRYNLLYRNLVGGAIAMFGIQFEMVNGFSNNFDGWGAEDDDFAFRLKSHGLNFIRFDPTIASYIMLPHIKEIKANNFDMPEEKQMLVIDGLSTLSYSLIAKKYLSLYTHILVSW